MRILHTSDWHIGRTFHGVDLLADQASALESVAALVRSHEIDVVVVPGDVYDRAIPSADAVAVCQRAFEAIREAGAVIVATSGNHDSATRLGAGAAFTGAGGLHLLTSVDGLDRPVVLQDAHGDVEFYGIPYLEPEISRTRLDAPDARSHADILSVAMARVRARHGDSSPGTRSVVLAHAFVVGGEATGSERSISVGGVETVPAGVFDGVDYVALGHLHSPQTVVEHVRYSGSPLPYSFGERSHRKAVWIVDLDAAGLASVERVDLPVVRGLSQLTGTLDELTASAEFDDAEEHYVSAVLTDPVRPVDAMRVLRERFPHAIHLEWQRPGGLDDLEYRRKVRGRSDLDVARSFVADVRSDATDGELALLERALTHSRVSGEHAVTVERAAGAGE
ncbi:exonuclease SbcCD subunit D [Rhodococcus sp. HNM0569]|uniref:exonuclease SbcCD subunit D n=1 Tax=Rhodococcus sp. HNM0569 TaxID=2716340 RepID=UPI00146BD72E|nr:exonuclease SbcCD subunit D [Rhodococcus sp. HNM0569]NLU83792.1 exonuclease SbcCD subunit D [Rhodococcus sp. HNM0569]